jgi:hypothetical protein
MLSHWDWAALRRICEREARRVLRSGPADVDDVVQAVLERAWRHRNRYLQPDAPEGWVARIAHREALREYRRSRRQTVMADPPEIAAEPRDDAVLETLERKPGRVQRGDDLLPRVVALEVHAGQLAHDEVRARDPAVGGVRRGVAVPREGQLALRALVRRRARPPVFVRASASISGTQFTAATS